MHCLAGAIKAVNDTLGKCQRGWFNMYIAQSVYDLSRLKCFMLLIKQILQDSLRTIVLTSVHAFSELITATSACVRTAESKEWCVYSWGVRIHTCNHSTLSHMWGKDCVNWTHSTLQTTIQSVPIATSGTHASAVLTSHSLVPCERRAS